MAKQGSIQINKKRQRLNERYKSKRAQLKSIVMDKETSIEEKFYATLQLSKLPRNSAANRIRNRCEITGRPRGYYRKFKMSRICLRFLANQGKLPGVSKASW